MAEIIKALNIFSNILLLFCSQRSCAALREVVLVWIQTSMVPVSASSHAHDLILNMELLVN
jgi:hypothetical protein